MGIRTLRAAISAAAVGLAVQAQAGLSTFDLTYNDGVNAATAVLTATPNGDGTYTAISGTLEVTAGAATGLYTLFQNPNGVANAYSPSGTFIYDNQLYPSQNPSIDNSGLLLLSGSREVNIWSGTWGVGASTPGYDFGVYDTSAKQWIVQAAGVGTGAWPHTVPQSGPISLTAVPEPTTMMAGLGGLGLALLGVFGSRRSSVIKIGQ